MVSLSNIQSLSGYYPAVGTKGVLCFIEMDL